MKTTLIFSSLIKLGRWRCLASTGVRRLSTSAAPHRFVGGHLKKLHSSLQYAMACDCKNHSSVESLPRIKKVESSKPLSILCPFFTGHRNVHNGVSLYRWSWSCKHFSSCQANLTWTLQLRLDCKRRSV